MSAARAELLRWTSPVDAAWDNPSCWDLGRVPGPGDDVVIATPGTNAVWINSSVNVASLTAGGEGSRPTIAVSSFTLSVTNGTVLHAGARLVSSNSFIRGDLRVAPGGVLELNGAELTGLTLRNEGLVHWRGGRVIQGRAFMQTDIVNLGLFEITADDFWLGQTYVENRGVIRKHASPGITRMSAIMENQGRVEVLSGSLTFLHGGELAGIWEVAPGARLEFNGGTFHQLKPVTFTGGGAAQLVNATLAVGGDSLPSGLTLISGELRLLPSFQGGSIVDLAPGPMLLRGTNVVTGRLLLAGSTVEGSLRVAAGGLLTTEGAADCVLNLTGLRNEGIVRQGAANLVLGASLAQATVTNHGLWEFVGDASVGFGQAAGQPTLDNRGVIRKHGGSGTSALFNLRLENTGAIEVRSGRLELPRAFVARTGVLRPQGGSLASAGGIPVAGGLVAGFGSFAAGPFTGGELQPDPAAPGPLILTRGLLLSEAVRFTPPRPGDRQIPLEVRGPVQLGNAALNLTGLTPPAGSGEWVLINNDGDDAVGGTFAGLPDDAELPGDGRRYRIRYGGGTGNDVVLVPVADDMELSFGMREADGGYLWNARVPEEGDYAFQASGNLVDWLTLETKPADSSRWLEFRDPSAGDRPFRFYRLTRP
jgi:hypothetical protein